MFQKGDQLVWHSHLVLTFQAYYMGTDKYFESIWQTYKNDINKVMSEKRNAIVTTLKHAFARSR
jgi:hypothetical protein